MNCDLLIKSNKIITLDEKNPSAKWVAVKNKQITEVGNGIEMPAASKILDFKDDIVLPGLIDSHVHGGVTAIMLAGVNLIEATSIAEVLELIDERCRTTQDELVFAPFFLQPQIKENRYPSRKELDRVSHGKKVMVISITLHGSSINTAAYESVVFPRNIDGVRMENGEFTGFLETDDAHFVAISTLLESLTEKEYEDYINLFAKWCVECGITTAHCLEGQFVEGDKDIDIWMKLIANSTLPFHCVLYPQVWDYDSAKRFNLPRHGGCLTLDGADIDFTMALNEPYSGRPELRGNLLRKDADLYDLVSKAHRDGKQCSFHAMGDRAIDQILWIYYRVIKEQGDKEIRHRIEHFTMPTSEHVKMAADLGIIVSQQPEFPYLFDYPGGPVEECFGLERAGRMEQYKHLSDAGIVVAGGSDAPVNSLNPLTGIHALVNTSKEGRKFDVTGALKLYTYNAAYAAFEEKQRGTIKTGTFADFTVLNKDPYEYPSEIKDLKVTNTISEGRIVYQSK